MGDGANGRDGVWAMGRDGDIVPEGLNERSQAVYCLEASAKKVHPVRVRYDGCDVPLRNCTRGWKRPNHTVPSGTVLLLNPFQPVNCLATFI